MYVLQSKGRWLNLPMDTQLELFDEFSVPILIYGFEVHVLGFSSLNIIENVHLCFC